jgi:hypothetical protein
MGGGFDLPPSSETATVSGYYLEEIRVEEWNTREFRRGLHQDVYRDGAALVNRVRLLHQGTRLAE